MKLFITVAVIGVNDVTSSGLIILVKSYPESLVNLIFCFGEITI